MGSNRVYSGGVGVLVNLFPYSLPAFVKLAVMDNSTIRPT